MTEPSPVASLAPDSSPVASLAPDSSPVASLAPDSSPAPVLVIGANGYLGSHVTRALVADGRQVRVMVRDGANTVGIDDLDVTRFVGDIWDDDVLRAAMTGCQDVYYCVVDTRGWLRDPAPLFRTNVDGTRNVLDVAVEPAVAPSLQKFVFTSSYVTVGRRRGKVATEADVIGDHELARLTPYVRSRVQAENLVLEYARRRGLPAVAMCVSTTYGAGDWGRTPHGAIIAGAAFGKLPFVMSGIELEAVGIEDAAAAMLLAAQNGRPGERYLISEKMISNAEVVRIAAEAAGVPAPTRSVPLPVSYAMAALGSLKARLQGTDERLSLDSLRLMRAEAPVDCGKARRELGWQPRPVEESIREAAKFWVGLREAKRAGKAAG
ncbi:NAD-dependent epimerase/dehydratase family protein [Mycolicibacterium vaccae]|uniref:NAD-dependent epimerase/dehydratase n=1 Tax=Mycolicibacterium vaccae ATCC 25954 TaxID=1194972 RepID=K0UV85_MYCVA|nr:NAD-dependent epimerase/dehydratase family protein [Mycolicibacterium vaccae]ANI42660.1 NAD-dependent dehydratase [Mycolicibacterium vaccae 95051]EJZ10716.1 NAD-dependent epimerase/dehydratase [Mycolicibacterium vaccae ATCC 25954]